MSNELYEKLIAQGMNEAIAKQLASEFVPKRQVAKSHKFTFAEWASRYSESETKTRLQAVMSLLSQLGVSVSTEMVNELKEFKPNTQEMLRRLGQLMDSKWIPQRDAGGKLSKLVADLEGSKPESKVEVSSDVDDFLADLSNLPELNSPDVVHAVESAAEEDNIDDDPPEKEEDEIIVDIESTDEENKPVVTIIGSPEAPKPLDLDLDKFM